MSQLNFYETIFKRKSIRKYDLEPLADKVLNEILDFVKEVKAMKSNIKTEMKIVSQKEVTSILPVKAPQYLVFSSENIEGYLTNAGFMLQQIDLYLSSRGIGCCYLGMTQPTRAVKKTSELEFVMVLALGNPAEPVYRKEVSEFKRKPLYETTNILASEVMLEPVRLAPSATNSQPWFFTGSYEVIHAYCIKPNFIKAMVYDKMNKIDMGIALCHLGITAEHFGKRVEFIKDKTAQENSPKGYYYITTAIIKKS